MAFGTHQQWRLPSRISLDEEAISLEGYLGPVPQGEYRDPDYTRFERQAFLVRMGRDRQPLPVHYHPVDQFQVFCWGSAQFAQHRVATGVVHYADRFTPYGPIQPLHDGVSFLTLRSESASGAHDMPEHRTQLAQYLHLDPRAASDRRSLSFELLAESRPFGAFVTLHDDDDGLRISRLQLDADEASLSMDIGGDGAFVVVIDGSLDTGDDTPAQVGSVMWNEPGTLDPLVGGSGGAVVAVLQFPHRP